MRQYHIIFGNFFSKDYLDATFESRKEASKYYRDGLYFYNGRTYNYCSIGR